VDEQSSGYVERSPHFRPALSVEDRILEPELVADVEAVGPACRSRASDLLVYRKGARDERGAPLAGRRRGSGSANARAVKVGIHTLRR
jgi:hypothetical protein